jgi:gamma-glutamyltranspeptidase/glutathione hydrolase
MTKRKATIAAPQPEAAEAGLEILRAGGNAMDAALGCALVQGVVDPMMSGLAGFGSMAVYGRDKKALDYIDFHAPAPAAATPEMWQDLIEGEARDGYGFTLKGRVNDIGYQSICVPASLRAYHDAHKDHGKLPWSDIVAPAIHWAKAGWVVRPHVHYFWSDPGQMGRVGNPERISFTPSARRLYCRPDGTPKRVGDTVVNTDLAEVLQQIARHGADVFYTGEIADCIDADMRQHGGLLSKQDLAAYKTKRNVPLRGTYRGFQVASNQPPGGGLMLLEMLNILERFELGAMAHNSVDYIKIVSEAMKAATIDKDRWIGDPDFVSVPVERLSSKAYAAEIAARIKAGERASVDRFDPAGPSKDTTQVTVVDADDNCVSMTHSLGMPSGVITDGLGFMYNGCMGVFDPRPGRAGSIAPGKARFSSVCPSIILKGDEPYLVIGAPGATQIAMGVLQVVLNVLDFGMPVQTAISKPRFSSTSNAIDVSNRIPRSITGALQADGYQVVRNPSSYAGFALVHAITVIDGVVEGGADPGGDGVALSL